MSSSNDRLLIKIVPATEKFQMSEAIPYKSAKPMYFVEDVDDREKLREIVEATVGSLGMLPEQ